MTLHLRATRPAAALLLTVCLCAAGGCVQRTVVTWTPASSVSSTPTAAGTGKASGPAAAGTTSADRAATTARRTGKTPFASTSRTASRPKTTASRTRKPSAAKSTRTAKGTIPSAYVRRYLATLQQVTYQRAASPVTIRNDRFTLTIPADVLYPRDAEAVILTAMRRLEEVTGLPFHPRSGLQPLEIHVTLDDWGFAAADAQSVTLLPMHLLFDSGNALGVLLEQLANTLLLRHIALDCPFFSEGFVLTAVEALEDGFTKPILTKVAAGYADYPDEAALLAGGERYLLQTEAGEASRAGYRFVRFLRAVKGSRAPADLVRALAAAHGDGVISAADVAAAAKEQYGPGIFGDFLAWYGQHKADFTAAADTPVDLRRFGRLDVFPLFRKQLLEYQPATFVYQSPLRIDLTSGFAFLQGQGYGIKGLFGTIRSTGRHTLTFYDQAGKVIVTRELVNGSLSLDIWGATRVDLSGDGSAVTFMPVVKKCTVR